MKKILLVLLATVVLATSANATLRNTKRFEYFNNSGGLNDKLSPIVIEDNQASDLQNVQFTLGGAIQKRSGFSSDNNATIDGRITGLYEYVQADSTRYLIQTAGDAIYKMDDLDGTFDDITGGVTIASDANVLFDFTTANNKLIATNQDNPVITWTGAGDVSTIAAAPQGKWVAFHQNIVFIANTSANPSRLQFSNVLDETTWTSTDWIDVGANDGQEITGLAVLLDTLYIFKNSSIYRLSGTNRDDFVLSRMVTDVGAIAGHSIQVIRNKMLFYTTDGIYIYDGGINVSHISEVIEDTLDGVNHDRDAYANSADFKSLNQYWLSISDGGSSNQDLVLVYDYFHNAWTKYVGIDAQAMTTVLDTANAEQLYTGSFAHNAVFKQNDTDTDFDQAIDAYYQTKWFRFPELISSENVLRLVRVFAGDDGNWDLTIGFKKDFGGIAQEKTLTLAGDSSTWGADANQGVWDSSIWGGDTIIIGRFPVTLRENFFQLRFSNDNAEEPFTVYGYQMFVEETDRI